MHVINTVYIGGQARQSKIYWNDMPDELRINTEGSIARTMRSERVQAALYFKENLRAIAKSSVQYETFILSFGMKILTHFNRKNRVRV